MVIKIYLMDLLKYGMKKDLKEKVKLIRQYDKFIKLVNNIKKNRK